MPLLSWKIDGTTYDLDLLFYGYWPMRRIGYEYSFPLFYDEKPEANFDAEANGQLGIYTVNGFDVSKGTPPGYGSADPENAQRAGDKLVEVGNGLSLFQSNVLQWNAAELGKQWEGPAHEALQRVLTGLDHWVSDSLKVSYSKRDPSGQGYDNPTYYAATWHRSAQSEYKRILGHYGPIWKGLFDWGWSTIDQAQKDCWYIEDGEYPYVAFNHKAFSKFLQTYSGSYAQKVDSEVLSPAKSEYDKNQSWLSTAYEGLIPNYVAVQASPWFEPAPPPDKTKEKKKDEQEIKIKIPDFKPPTFDPPDTPGTNSPGGDVPSMNQPSGSPATGMGGGGPDASTGTSGLGGPPTSPESGPTGEQGQGRGVVTGPDGRTGFDVTGDGVPDLGLNGLSMPGGGLPPGSRMVTGPDGTRGVDLNGDGVPDVGLDGRALPGGSLPPGTRLITGPDGQTGIDVTGDGVPDLGLDGNPLPGGGLPPGSELVTGPDGTVGIDLDGDGIPDIGLDGWALPDGSLPEGAHLVTGPDGVTGFDITGDGVPDFGLDGEHLPGSTFSNPPGARDLGSQVIRPSDDLRGSPGAMQASGLPATGSMMPMMPMGGGMGGMGGGGGGQNQNNERERQTWLLEEDKVWRGEAVVATAVLGRPVEDDDEPPLDEWEAPTKPRPARTKPGRPGQRPTPGGWTPSRVNK